MGDAPWHPHTTLSVGTAASPGARSFNLSRTELTSRFCHVKLVRSKRSQMNPRGQQFDCAKIKLDQYMLKVKTERLRSMKGVPQLTRL